MMTWDFGCGTGLIKFVDLIAVMSEGEKHWGVPVVIGGDNLPTPV